MFLKITFINLSMCFITYKNLIATFLAFNGDTRIGISPNAISRITTFQFVTKCYEIQKSNTFSRFCYNVITNRITIRIYL